MVIHSAQAAAGFAQGAARAVTGRPNVSAITPKTLSIHPLPYRDGLSTWTETRPLPGVTLRTAYGNERPPRAPEPDRADDRDRPRRPRGLLAVRRLARSNRTGTIRRPDLHAPLDLRVLCHPAGVLFLEPRERRPLAARHPPRGHRGLRTLPVSQPRAFLQPVLYLFRLLAVLRGAAMGLAGNA